MRLWAILFVLPTLVCSAARAEEWTLENLTGEVSQRAGGDWRPLTGDSPLCGGAEIKTGAEGSLVMSGETSILAIPGNSQFRCNSGSGDSGSAVNVEAGLVGVQSLPGKESDIEVRSQFVEAHAKGADFLINADGKASTVVVKSGVVDVRDLLRQKDVQVSAGQTLKFGAADADPSTDSATAQFQKQIDSARADYDKANAKDGAKDPKSKVDAAAVGKDLKKKLGVKKGKLDAASAANAAKVASDFASSLNDDENADDPDKKANLALPLRTYLFENTPSALALIWAPILGVAFALGYILNQGAKEVAFGTFGNTFILLIGVIIGAFVRDAFFFNGFWYQFEPYVSMAVLISCAFALMFCAMIGKFKLAEARERKESTVKNNRVRVVFHDPSRSRAA